MAFAVTVANTAQTVVIDGVGYTSGTLRVPPYKGVLTDPDESALFPKAHLNWATFDRDWKFLDGGAKQLKGGAENGTDVDFGEINSSIEIKEPGYVYIWLSNTSAAEIDVYFDDFKVTHTKSPVVATDEYYPGGAMFNSYIRENSVINKRKYQSKEWQPELGLELFDFGPRQYDGWLLRTITHDPSAEKFYPLSPYSWVANNPVLLIDPTGKDWTITSTEDKEGRKQYHVNFTGAVLNLSSNKKINMASFAIAIMKQMESTFDQTVAKKDGTLDYDISFTSSIRVVDDKKDIAKDETAIEIKDSGHDNFKTSNPSYGVPGIALNGKEIAINEAYVGDMIRGKNSKTLPHEAGHTGGLRHPLMDFTTNFFGQKKEGETYNSPKTNFMYQGTVKTPTGPTREQMDRMLRLYRAGWIK